MKFFQKIDKGLALCEKTVLIVAVLAMIVLAFAQVILRNFFETGLVWADVLLRNMVLWTGFLGAQLATRASRHIRMDFLTRFLPARFQGASHCVTHVFTAGVCFILGWASLRFVQMERMGDSVLYGLGIPTWWSQIIIPVGFFIMSFRFLMKLFEDVQGLRTP